jgi:hypothetical protein
MVQVRCVAVFQFTNVSFNNKKMIKKILIFHLVVVMCASCSKFLDVGTPSNNIVSEAVYQSSYSAAGVLTGIYPDLYDLLTGTEFFFKCSLMADDLTLYDQISGLEYYYSNNYRADGEFWIKFYGFLYRINSAIEGLNGSDALPINEKRQLLGEAYFLRAFCYFYLVNLYGGVPLVTKSDYKENSMKTRSSIDDVFNRIISDLSDAREMLSDDYLSPDIVTITNDRVRPTKDVATAFLSRVYLHKGDWKLAEIESSAILNKKTKYDLVSMSDVFLKNSQESIWQIQPSNPVGFNTLDARVFVLINGPDMAHPVYLNPTLMESFENRDLRKSSWIGVSSVGNEQYYYPFKYKLYKEDDADGEYLTIFRIAEQYLIRSEARVQMNNINGAVEDLNIIRNRAGLETWSGGGRDLLLNAILHERRSEFFAECGHRWFDLKRIGKADDIMPAACASKGGQWFSYKQLLPISIADIRLNPNIEQNPGYSQ